MESAPTWGVYGGGNVPDFEPPRCGGRERPPYGTGEIRRPPGKMQSPRYTVGADSISARFTAAQGSAGGINPAPTGKFCVSGKPGTAMFVPVCRGPRPSRRGPRQGRPGRYGIGPYMGCLRRRGVPGTMRASSPTYLCNYARSAFSRQTRTSSTVVGADSISARFSAARGLREGHAPPLHAVRERPAKWDCRGHPGERRAGCPHPAAPRGSSGFRGRDKSRPYEQILHLGAAKTPPHSSFLIPHS